MELDTFYKMAFYKIKQLQNKQTKTIYTYTRPHTRTHTCKQSELFLSGVYLRLQITGELFEIDNVG